MATVYKVEIVSDWINYTEEELKKLIEENLDPDRQNIRVTEGLLQAPLYCPETELSKMLIILAN